MERKYITLEAQSLILELQNVIDQSKSFAAKHQRLTIHVQNLTDDTMRLKVFQS